MQRRTRVFTGLALGVVLFAAGAFGVIQTRPDDPETRAVATGGPVAAAAFSRADGSSLEATISNLQNRLKSVPGDYVSWATLGIAYVQQAKVAVNSDFYPRADGALAKSLEIDTEQNFLAYAGLSALANARHDFAAAKQYAEQGLAINAKSAILLGALSDAETQLGNYDAAADAVQRMVDRSPDTTSLSRASYTFELRGDVERARELMQRALDDAPTAADKAFALFYLGELTFNAGDPNGALTYYRSALEQSPSDAAALAGKAKAEAAIGQTMTALDDYAEVIGRAPEPTYVIEYGELLESLGRLEEAQQQYDLFATVQQLFAANGVEPDSAETLFAANHGDPAVALAEAERGIVTRPFLAMYDAYAWALHANGRDAEALEAMDTALSTGLRSASFHFHRGMIQLALGDADGARASLTTAITINPYFSPLDAPIAVATLAELGGAA